MVQEVQPVQEFPTEQRRFLCDPYFMEQHFAKIIGKWQQTLTQPSQKVGNGQKNLQQ